MFYAGPVWVWWCSRIQGFSSSGLSPWTHSGSTVPWAFLVLEILLQLVPPWGRERVRLFQAFPSHTLCEREGCLLWVHFSPPVAYRPMAIWVALLHTSEMPHAGLIRGVERCWWGEYRSAGSIQRMVDIIRQMLWAYCVPGGGLR